MNLTSNSKIMKSNLKINSNVFIRRKDFTLSEDTKFLPQIRGFKAVRKFLWRVYEIEPTAEPKGTEIMHLLRQGKITRAQWNSLNWGIFCYRCDSIPEGQTFEGNIEFRCQREGCK